MRRAARWDGAVPLFASARHGQPPDLGEVRDLIAYVGEHRSSDSPFDYVIGGISPADPAAAAELIAPYRDAGATWWDERQIMTGPDLHSLDAVLRRIEAGPPAL